MNRPSHSISVVRLHAKNVGAGYTYRARRCWVVDAQTSANRRRYRTDP
jgi:hypothetical protein